MKMLVTMMTQRFDMKFVDEEKYHSGSLPLITLSISHYPELIVELRERKSR